MADSMNGYQAIIGRTWRNACPSAPRVQVRGAARGCASVGFHDNRQLAKHPTPTREPIRTFGSLQNFLKDRRRKPDGLLTFKRSGEQINFEPTFTAQERDPHR